MVENKTSENKLAAEQFRVNFSEIQSFLSSKFHFDVDVFKDTSTFYKSVKEKLFNSIEVTDDVNLLSILEAIGISEIKLSDPIFVIKEMPNEIVRLQYRELNLNWDKYWGIPEIDALILQIPKGKSVMLTHWNVLYFD